MMINYIDKCCGHWSISNYIKDQVL